MTHENESDCFVVVPVYNHERFVEKCLRSIFVQTRRPRKLLVIDDGSPDGSARVCERVLRDCPFDSEFITRENRGLCATLNEGLAASDGKYFAYLGSDDIWLPRFLEERVRLLKDRAEAVLAYGHTYFVDAEDNVFETSADYDDERGLFIDGDARRMLLDMIVPPSASVCYRRVALDGPVWNEASRLEDYEMYLQLAAKGPFAFDPQLLSVWRHHGDNTGSKSEMMAAEVTAAQERNFELLGISRTELDRVQTQARFRYARMMMQHGQKRAAMKLGFANTGGARSIAELAAFGLRFLVPMSLVEARRKERSERKQGVVSVAELT
jgi:glycosyltransferase involved in cell wall biosynthesis